MFNDRISDYFEGVAAKYLSAVDADPGRSNQHEIGGLPSAGFRQWLGTPNKDEKYYFDARQVYIPDETDEPEIVDTKVSWYDCRYNKQDRSPEYRLYYTTTSVTRKLQAGDFFLIAKRKDGSLLMVFTPPGSSVEGQLRAIFGLSTVGSTFLPGVLASSTLLLPLRLLLEDIGIDLNPPSEGDGEWLDRLVSVFGGTHFPTTAEFSKFARKSVENETDPLTAPDEAIMCWMDQEEKLFRIYERHIVRDRLIAGFGKDGDDVDEFIGFSLSVQNRRKSRVGHAFEGHLGTLFANHGLKFEQGGKNRFTENNNRPDFLFPSFAAYHDPIFPDDALIMLGAKTTCKDRWRQVLSEADRIEAKHLVTLEAAISETQTREMKSKRLQLVIPASIHETYSTAQRTELLDVATFISAVRNTQQVT